MKLLFKIVFLVSVSTIFILIVFLIVKSLLPLEFANGRQEERYDEFRFWGLPLAIILTLTGTIKPKDTGGDIVRKIVLTALVSMIPVFLMFMTALSGMCSWTTNETLFVNSTNTSKKIVRRSYGCGAVDSQSPSYGAFKVKKLPLGFIWVTKADTLNIDRKVWIKPDAEKE
jgi:hypothetical protein